MSEEDYRRLFGKSREEMVSETRAELRDAIKNKQKGKAKELLEKLKKVFVGDDVFWANEVASNIFVSVVMLLLGVILLLTVVLSNVHVFAFDNTLLIPAVSVCLVQLAVGLALTTVFHGEKVWLKYVDMFLVCSTIAMATAFMGYRAAISLALPVVLSVKYLSARYTKWVSVLAGIFMLSSTVGSAFIAIGPDLNTMVYAPGTTVTITTTLEAALLNEPVVMSGYVANLLKESFLPNLMQYLLICYICITIAGWCHKTVLTQADVSKEFARVDAELNTARDIQANMLPRIFPPFPDRREFDIFAKMDPAKEVGGDFYDFFMVDDDHLAIVMADVSGKGVPAALFMMIGKAFIKNKALTGAKPSEVFNYVNNELCENNDMELFITAWLGVVELSTGHVIAANAGHEYPMIRRADGDYELFKEKHGLVLAGMEDFIYNDYEFDLHPGDGLFVYTDGCTEATNSQYELFGTDRLLAALRHNEGEAPETAIQKVRAEIDAFVGDAPQFDDITMLELIYNGPRANDGKAEQAPNTAEQ